MAIMNTGIPGGKRPVRTVPPRPIIMCFWDALPRLETRP